MRLRRSISLFILASLTVTMSCIPPDPEEDRAAIGRVVNNSIGWALTKDLDLLYSSLAQDSAFFIFHPDSGSTVVGWREFEPLTEVWLNPAFTATRFEVKDLRINLSRSGTVAWLNVFPIEVPSLRERKEDIPLLVWFFVTNAEGRYGKHIKTIPQETMDSLVSYDWPGNVRELEHVVERAMILSPDTTLRVDESFTSATPDAIAATAPDSVSLEQVERAHIIRTLQECGWKVKGKGNAADLLGLSESTLRYRMKKLGIERPGA